MDIHLSKQILEISYIFYTARHILGLKDKNGYGIKHRYKNHVLVKWTCSNYNNYKFIYEYAKSVNEEMKYRNNSNNSHKSFLIMKNTIDSDTNCIRSFFSENPIYKYMPQAMPINFRQPSHNFIYAYRVYYFYAKRYYMPIVSFKNRTSPYWYNNDYFLSFENESKIQCYLN